MKKIALALPIFVLSFFFSHAQSSCGGLAPVAEYVSTETDTTLMRLERELEEESDFFALLNEDSKVSSTDRRMAQVCAAKADECLESARKEKGKKESVAQIGQK